LEVFANIVVSVQQVMIWRMREFDIDAAEPTDFGFSHQESGIGDHHFVGRQSKRCSER
jgi:hypothetical protein